MVYLVRTTHFLRDWEKAGALYNELSTYIKDSYAEVKDSYFLMNIAGPVDQLHWVLAFESLADEEKYAARVFEDQKYVEAMKKSVDLLSPPIDRLYRKMM